MFLSILAAPPQAQLEHTEQRSSSVERTLREQLQLAQNERDACLEAATRADNLLSRLGGQTRAEAGVTAPPDKHRTVRERVAQEELGAKRAHRLAASNAALDGAAAAGTALLKLRGMHMPAGSPRLTKAE